jgi:lipoprotein-anchoring transpeptidase ErfK/SrfK
MARPYPLKTTHRHPAAPRKAKRSRPNSGIPTLYLIVAAAGLAAMAPFFFLAALWLYINVSGLILPNVWVGPVNLGGMNRDQAQIRLEQAWNQGNGFLVTDGEQVWSAPSADFGLWLDAQATAERAYQSGRQNPSDTQNQQGPPQILQAFTGRRLQVEPVIQYQPERARQQLEHWAGLVGTPPQNGSLAYQDGRWQPIPGQPGRALNIDATLAVLSADPSAAVSSGSLMLQMTDIPPAVDSVSPELLALLERLNAPLSLRLYDPIDDTSTSLTIPQDTLAGWVNIDSTGSTPQVRLNDTEVNAYLTGQQGVLSGGKTIEPIEDTAALQNSWQTGSPFTVIVRRPATEYIVQPGDSLISIGMTVGMPVWKIAEANPGIDSDRLFAGQSLVIPSKNEMLPYPVVVDKRIVISISRQRMWTYENGQLLWEAPVSTGIDRSPTYPGIYQIQTHEVEAYASVWDLYMPHFLGIYEGWPGFMNGIHGLPTLSSGRQLWADVLGSKASYGCIILDLQRAEQLFNWTETGVVVEIQP